MTEPTAVPVAGTSGSLAPLLPVTEAMTDERRSCGAAVW